MNPSFNASEIFEIACQIERNGAKFYEKAVAVASTEESKLFLSRLSDMEKGHEDLFSKMKEEIDISEENLPDSEMQCLSYLQAMAEGKIFSNRLDASELLKNARTLEELYLVAIGFEKDSVIFFTGIREVVPDQLGKNKIDLLIKEEMCHIAVLSRELTAVRNGKACASNCACHAGKCREV